MTLVEVNGHRVLEVDPTGAPLGTEADVTELIGEAYVQEADVIALPVSRLHSDFFVLRTGMAGPFLQKIQTYGFRLAVVGDISGALATSTALRAFVHESNQTGQTLFVTDRSELAERL